MNFSGESALSHSRRGDFGPSGWKALLFVGGTLLASWSSHIAAWAVVTTPSREGRMAIQYKCYKCWKTAGTPGRCCSVPMTRVSLDEGIFWPLMWPPTQGDRG